MKKILAINLDLVKRNEYPKRDIKDDFDKKIKEMESVLENKIIFYSHHQNLVDLAKKAIGEQYVIINVDALRSKIKNNRASHFIIIGKKDTDFIIAVNYKLLFIVPTWLKDIEQKAQKYGILVDTPYEMKQFIETINNQNFWYIKKKINESTTVLSLMDAKYRSNCSSSEERIIIEHFQQLLKTGGSRNYYVILLYHFLAAMTNTTFFDDIQLWGIVPSSDCTLNEDMFNFKETVRYIKNGKEPRNQQYPNVLERKKMKSKAHLSNSSEPRNEWGAKYEFQTLIVNPEYKSKIQRLKREEKLNVCIFDDYLTHGNTFEAVRNLFENLGANKIICVSLGSFMKAYQQNDYILTGDVYSVGYEWKKTHHQQIDINQFEINPEAKNEIAALYDIFNVGENRR